MVGEIRDRSTIRTAISAAETGHLVFASVHGADVLGAIERITGVFPGDEQAMIRQTLGTSLRAVIAQHLLLLDSPKNPNSQSNSQSQSRVLASEVLIANSATANLISNGNLNQIRTVLETSAADGMHTLDASLARLLKKRKISRSVACGLARNPQLLVEMAKVI